MAAKRPRGTPSAHQKAKPSQRKQLTCWATEPCNSIRQFVDAVMHRDRSAIRALLNSEWHRPLLLAVADQLRDRGERIRAWVFAEYRRQEPAPASLQVLSDLAAALTWLEQEAGKHRRKPSWLTAHEKEARASFDRVQASVNRLLAQHPLLQRDGSTALPGGKGSVNRLVAQPSMPKPHDAAEQQSHQASPLPRNQPADTTTLQAQENRLDDRDAYYVRDPESVRKEITTPSATNEAVPEPTRPEAITAPSPPSAPAPPAAESGEQPDTAEPQRQPEERDAMTDSAAATKDYEPQPSQPGAEASDESVTIAEAADQCGVSKHVVRGLTRRKRTPLTATPSARGKLVSLAETKRLLAEDHRPRRRHSNMQQRTRQNTATHSSGP